MRALAYRLDALYLGSQSEAAGAQNSFATVARLIFELPSVHDTSTDQGNSKQFPCIKTIALSERSSSIQMVEHNKAAFYA